MLKKLCFLGCFTVYRATSSIFLVAFLLLYAGVKLQIYLLLTDDCNLECSMCIRGKQNGTNIDFTLLKEMKWLSELKEHDIVVTGGEPTMHPQFVDIVSFLCDHAKKVTVTTNGTINSYLNKGFLHKNLYFQISIDGDAKTHNSIRGIGTYQKSMNTIKSLDAIGAQYSVATVANKNNTEAVKLLAKELKKLNNIRYWRISYEMPFGSAGFENMMTASEWNIFVDEMIDLAKLRMKIMKIFPFDLYDRKKDYLDQIIGTNRRYNNCGSGKSKIYIYPDFQVYSCTCLTDFPLGNLKESNLAEILCGKEIQKFTNYEVKNKICINCEYLKYCNGGCIGMSYHYFKELGMGDVRCPILQQKGVKVNETNILL